MPQSKKPARHRGIYLLPNLFTTAGLFAGFYSIVAARKGMFDLAAIAIFIAMITDALDGRVARMTATQSEFGAEYDSLSDMVAFGVAPALVVYSWALINLGKVGWLAAFLYTAASALRLARFNTQTGEESDKRYFQGLASPAAAGTVASMVWIAYSYGIAGYRISIIPALITVLVAGLMVSNIPYRSFKEIDLKGKVPFIAILSMVLIFVGIAIDPPQMLFIIFFTYSLSGPIGLLWKKYKKSRKEKK